MSRRPRSRSAWTLLGCAMLAWAAAGCGGDGLIPVTGQVTLDGEPLKAGSVTFHPDGGKGNRTQHIPAGMVEGGVYVVFTNGVKGAPPGPYKVTVTATDFSGKAPPKTATAQVPKSLIAERYGAKTTTPLEVEVVPSPAAGAYNLKVSRN